MNLYVMAIILVIVIAFIGYWLSLFVKNQSERSLKDLVVMIQKSFGSLANQSLIDNLNFIQDSSTKELRKALEPFKEQSQQHEMKLDRMHRDAALERHTLTETLKSVAEMKQGLSEDARTFSRAMRGNIRAVGKFGENKAELTLIASGYQEGTDYKKQKLLKSVKNDIQPDFLIMLPGERGVFLDSKLPLDSFMSYCEQEDESKKKDCAKEFSKRVMSHVDDLFKKEYQSCVEIKSMDFVLMYIGSDHAISVALEHDPELIRNAISKKIIVVGPTTLMSSLKTIEFLWKDERQKENFKEISEIGGHLFTKLSYFLQKMKDSQDALEKSKAAFEVAFNHLNRGDKNILSDLKKLRDLGGFSQKPLPEVKETK